MPTQEEQSQQEEIRTLLKNLDARITRIESHLNLRPEDEEVQGSPAISEEEREDALELQIGQNWFAKAGIVGLAAGIMFLLTFPYSNIPPFIPSLAGYILVGAIVFLSSAWKTNYEQISRYLFGGGLILLYFTTLRLAYFSPDPAVTDRTIETALLSVVVIVNLAISLRRQSPYLTTIGLLLGCLTALLSGQSYVALVMLTLLAVVTAYAFIRFQWLAVLLIGTLLVYKAQGLLAINNPLIGNPLRMVGGPEAGNIFLIAFVAIFAVGALRGLADRQENFGHASAAALNGGSAFLLLLMMTKLGQQADVALWHTALSVVALALAGAFWKFKRSKYSTFVYAMIGYTALSVAIVEWVAKPDFFVWLCWESVLVLVTAVWFQSRFIVVANFIIFLMVFLAYLFTAGTVGLVNVNFGLAALLSARILNWQRDRLELHTEMMRNAYLGSALFVIPYALYHSMPAGFVALSWLAVALCYYVFSRLLKSRKYRWMAIFTVLMTIVYVFAINLVGFDPMFRIVSLLVLGIALLAVSMIYGRRKASRAEKKRE